MMTKLHSLGPTALFAILVAAPAVGQGLGPPPVPPENPQSSAKINLGKVLFWEEQLSNTGTVACGTCHRPSAGGSDPRTALGGWGTVHPGPNGLFGTSDDILASAGVPRHDAGGAYQPTPSFGVAPQVGPRKSPNIFTAAFVPDLFWDGRAGTSFQDPLTGHLLIPDGAALENQALAPLLDTSEMGHIGNTVADVPDRLDGRRPLALAESIPAPLDQWIDARSYPELFAEVFGTPEITPARLAFAIASYQRRVNETHVPFDDELNGVPALTPQERAGRLVFEFLQCNECHAGALHSDNSFRYIGVRPVDDDLGRFNQTGDPQHRGQFKVPSLRNVGLRAPYFHNGRFQTLELVVDFYMRAGDFDATNKDPLMIPRSITPTQRSDLLAYLRGALTDPRIAGGSPPFDRPTLYTESARVPVIEGSGVAGIDGVPQIAALEPAFQGNSRFTLSVSRARIGATATLVVSRSDPGVHTTVPVGDFANIPVLIADGGFVSRGYATTRIDLSQEPLVGQALHGRFYVPDPVAPGGLAVSRALKVTVFDAGLAPADVILSDGFE